MKLSEFLRTKTQAKELCVIRDDGWITETAWIDYEDLFCRCLSENGSKKVKGDEWGTLPIVTEHGDKLDIPCHYVDI